MSLAVACVQCKEYGFDSAEQLSPYVTTTDHENHNHRACVQGKILHDARKVPRAATKPLSSKKTNKQKNVHRGTFLVKNKQTNKLPTN